MMLNIYIIKTVKNAFKLLTIISLSYIINRSSFPPSVHIVCLNKRPIFFHINYPRNN